jgi:hypothetical protein
MVSRMWRRKSERSCALLRYPCAGHGIGVGMSENLKRIFASCCLLGAVNAQDPLLWMSPRANLLPSTTPIATIVNSPSVGAPFVVICDVASGPVSLLGVDIQLGFTPVMTTVIAGVTGATASIGAFNLPPGIESGLTLYGQAFVLDPTAPNGLFRASNGASTTVLDTQTGPEFDMSIHGGYTGTFEQGYRQLIAAEPDGANAISHALSPWLPGVGSSQPSYGEPIVAQVLPFDTEIQLEYRGAEDGFGSNPSEWGPSPSIADGRPFLQFRATFRASLVTGARPILTDIIVPHL